MYKQSHNNNDIESMIFVLHIEGRIFCNCFWYFLFLHYLQFSQGAALGTSGHSGKENLSGGGLASWQEDKVLLDVGMVQDHLVD